MPPKQDDRSHGMHPAILVIDIGGTNVKLELSTPRQLCKFESGSELTAKAMVAKVKDLACPFRKFHPAWIRTIGQNHRIVRGDDCDPAFVGIVYQRICSSRAGGLKPRICCSVFS